MGKTKLIEIEIPENEAEKRFVHYARLGFEVVKSDLYTVKSDSGAVIRKYYKNFYRFNFERENAEKLWNYYKLYKKKNRELKFAESESDGKLEIPHKFFFPIAVLGAIPASMLMVEVFYEGGFLNFLDDIIYGYDIGGFDVFALVYSPLIGCFVGYLIALLFELIAHAFLRKKRLLKAIDRIPVLEKEIEDLTVEAMLLQSK